MDATFYLFSNKLIDQKVFNVNPPIFILGEAPGVNPAKGIIGCNLAEMPPRRPRVPMHDDTGRLFAGIEEIVTGAQKNVNAILGEQSIAGRGIANLKAGVNFKGASAKLGLNNIFGRKYFEHLSYMRSFFVYLSYRY